MIQCPDSSSKIVTPKGIAHLVDVVVENSAGEEVEVTEAVESDGESYFTTTVGR